MAGAAVRPDGLVLIRRGMTNTSNDTTIERVKENNAGQTKWWWLVG